MNAIMQAGMFFCTVYTGRPDLDVCNLVAMRPIATCIQWVKENPPESGTLRSASGEVVSVRRWATCKQRTPQWEDVQQ